MVFSKYTDLLPKEVLNEDTPELQKPDEEAIQEVRCGALCVSEKAEVQAGCHHIINIIIINIFHIKSSRMLMRVNIILKLITANETVNTRYLVFNCIIFFVCYLNVKME